MKIFTCIGIFLWIAAGLTGISLASDDALIQAQQEAVKANPNAPTPHFNLGVAYFKASQYDLAIPEFQKYLQLNPKDQQAKELLESSEGISAYLGKKYADAVNHLNAVLKLNPINPNANLLLGKAYIQLNQYENAEAALKKYLAAFPDDREVQANANEDLSKIYMDQKNYPKAVEALKRVLAVDRGNFGAFQNLGVAYFQMKDYAHAVTAWNSALKIKKDARIYKFLGFSYYNLGKFPEAIQNYEKSKKMNPDDSETFYNLAVAYYDNGLYDEAAGAFGEAFKINPKDSDAAVGRGNAIDAAINANMEKASNYLLNNQYTEAISEWQAVLKYQPNNKQAQDFITDARGKLETEVQKHYAAGRAYSQKGNTLKALTEWNTVLVMDPNNAKALGAVQKIKSKTKDQVKALLEEGDELRLEKDYSGALQKYQKASKIGSKNTVVRQRLNGVKQDQKTEFEKYYKQGQKSVSSGQLQSALKSLQIASGIDPSNTKVRETLFLVRTEIRNKVNGLMEEGVSLMENGSKDQAQVKFQQVLELDPNNVKANDYVKRMTGQQSQQKVDAEKIKNLYYDGVNLYINGKIHEAIEKWKECLRQDPEDINAQNNIKKAMVKLQSIEKLSRN